ncbi:MAG: hypothetical protein WCP39_06835, partial [Chlamydiota bacterium]
MAIQFNPIMGNWKFKEYIPCKATSLRPDSQSSFDVECFLAEHDGEPITLYVAPRDPCLNKVRIFVISREILPKINDLFTKSVMPIRLDQIETSKGREKATFRTRLEFNEFRSVNPQKMGMGTMAEVGEEKKRERYNRTMARLFKEYVIEWMKSSEGSTSLGSSSSTPVASSSSSVAKEEEMDEESIKEAVAASEKPVQKPSLKELFPTSASTMTSSTVV